MKAALPLLLHLVLALPSAPAGAQAGPSAGAGAAAAGSGTSPDPIAVATASVLKGQTNAEQRKLIRRQYLTLAAERAEEALRTEAFRAIIGFVEQNRDLFVRIYSAMRQARGSMAVLHRSRAVVVLQGDVLLLLGRTGEAIGRVETFSPEEIRQLMVIVSGILTEVEDDLGVLLSVFDGGFGAEVSDADRLELLDTVYGRLEHKRASVLQLQRYVQYLELNRRPTAVRGAERLFEASGR